jgi:hypothetical protein
MKKVEAVLQKCFESKKLLFRLIMKPNMKRG